MGEWEKAQEGEKDKGKGGSKRKVVRREDAEEEEVVTRVNKEEEELEEFGAEIFEAGEKFEEEENLRPGTVSQIRDQLSGTGLVGYTEMTPSVYFKLLGESLNARDEALEQLDEMTKKERRKKKKEKKKEKSPSSDDEGEEMEEEEK